VYPIRSAYANVATAFAKPTTRRFTASFRTRPFVPKGIAPRAICLEEA
jgi:hypothetical protein